MLKLFSSFLFILYQSSTVYMAGSGDNEPIKQQKTLAEYFQEENNELSDKETVEKPHLIRDNTFKDFSNQDIVELLDLLKKGANFRFTMKSDDPQKVNANLKQYTRQLQRLPHIRIGRHNDDQENLDEEQIPEQNIQVLPFDRLQQQSLNEAAIFGSDYAKWVRWERNMHRLENLIGTLRICLDRWHNEVKRNKQTKISAQELGINFTNVLATKREWDATRQQRIAQLVTMLNPSEGSATSAAASEQNHAAGGKKLVRGGPYVNGSLYSKEIIESLEKEGQKVLLTKKYDVVAHGKAIEEAKENLDKFGKEMNKLAKLETQLVRKPCENMAQQKRTKKHNEGIAQKIVKQINAINGLLNCLFLNVSEMAESGFTPEKKILSKKFGELLLKIQCADEQIQDEIEDDENEHIDNESES